MKKSDIASYFSKLGRKGGRVSSQEKLDAVRANLERANAARRKYPRCPRYKNHSHRFSKSGACACGYRKEEV